MFTRCSDLRRPRRQQRTGCWAREHVGEGSLPEGWTREREIEWAKTNNFRQLLGIEVDFVEAGFARLRLPVGDHVLQAANVVHGGVLASLVDSAIGTAVRTVIPEHSSASTIELNISYLRPAGAGTLTAEASILRAGRTVVVGTAEVRDSDGRLVAVGRAIYIVSREGEPPVQPS